MNIYEPESQNRSNIFRHTGFQVGLVGGTIMTFVSLAIFFINGTETDGDLLVWLIQLVVYVFLARTAANRQSEMQTRNYEPTRGVQGAAVGAPLTTSLMMWLFIVARWLVLDGMGATVDIQPFNLCGWVILDVVIALAIGAVAGRAVVKQHEGNPYDTSNF